MVLIARKALTMGLTTGFWEQDIRSNIPIVNILITNISTVKTRHVATYRTKKPGLFNKTANLGDNCSPPLQQCCHTWEISPTSDLNRTLDREIQPLDTPPPVSDIPPLRVESFTTCFCVVQRSLKFLLRELVRFYLVLCRAIWSFFEKASQVVHVYGLIQL